MTPNDIPAADEALRSEIRRVFDRQRERALELRESTAEVRIEKIRRLQAAVAERRADIVAAMAADFGKPEVEVDLSEIMVVNQEAKAAIRHLKRWMRPRRAKTPQALFGTFSHIRFEPKGVTLIIAPWNYPVNLLLGPLISSLAAGNTAMLKPSEMTPRTSGLMRELLHELFDEADVRVFEGEADVAQALLELPFDHCFFTGSPAVGKIVMAACAQNLTSVTLELGGKSPAIVDASADPGKAARSLAFGKCQNAGQACISPDYLLVHDAVHDDFVREFDEIIAKRFGKTPELRRSNPDFARLINERHFDRVKRLLDDALERGAVAAVGGDADAAQRYIAPTLLTRVPDEAAVLEEEIFGPLLPIVRWRELDEAIDRINARPKPLALYVYAQDQAVIDRVLTRTSAGDSAINTCMVHFVNHHLPFGGVNNSGMGKAHGHHGFKTFSHERSVLRNRFANNTLFSPPYGRFMHWLARFVSKHLA